MQIHLIKPNTKRKTSRRIGRGGKRGTYSGRGQKGQQARSGSGPKIGFTGGDQPLWKVFPKKRGASKKVDVKHRTFRLKRLKPFGINVSTIEKLFEVGATINPETLLQANLIPGIKAGAKILGQGDITKKFIFIDVQVSKSAKEKIEKVEGIITNG